jgi:predicted RNase H-like HicB family nuclease
MSGAGSGRPRKKTGATSTSSIGFPPSKNPGYDQETGELDMKYAVIYEMGQEGWYSAYVPDLQGCVAAAGTLEEVRTLLEEAIEFHIEGMRLHGEVVPDPSSLAEMVEA